MVVTTITKKHTLVNFSNQKITPKYIVWHDTGVRDQSDEGNANYFYSVYREASANYFIDENSIMEVVAPGYVAWHCGDGNGKYGITNYNSIGIELCVEADGNFKPETIANAVWLGKKLMADWRISYEGNVRRYDASRKNCPQFLNTDGKWSKWYSFKAKLAINTASNVVVQKQSVPIGGFNLGNKVAIRPAATHYQTGQPIADWAKNKLYTILQVKKVNQSASNKAYLLSSINSWVLEQDLTTSVTAATPASISVPAQANKWVKESGTFYPNIAIGVRSEPKDSSPVISTYYPGDSVRYDSWYNDGTYVWVHYISYTKADRYIKVRFNGDALGTFN